MLPGNNQILPRISSITAFIHSHRRLAHPIKALIRIMAQSSAQAAPPPPSRPASPNLPSTNQRSDEVAGDESAPLLPNQDPPRPGVVSARAMHIITSSAVSSAVCTLVFLIVIAILMSTLPNGTRLPGQTSEAFGAVVAPVGSCNLLGRI